MVKSNIKIHVLFTNKEWGNVKLLNYIWLSFVLGLNDPRPPAIPKPKLLPLYSIEKDNANVQTLQVATHTGTHIDSPRHVFEHGISITDFSPDELIFTKPAVLDLKLEDEKIVLPLHLYQYSNIIGNADIVLFRFGYGTVRKYEPERYSLKSPGFGIESARWLKENFKNLRAIGMDVPSFCCIAFLEQTMAAHNVILAGKGCRFLIIEDMNLEHDLTRLIEVRLCPWLVEGMDSSPCSVVGVTK